LLDALFGEFESGRKFAAAPGLVGSAIQLLGRLSGNTAAAVQQKDRDKERGC
jgi:hypothetical protein